MSRLKWCSSSSLVSPSVSRFRPTRRPDEVVFTDQHAPCVPGSRRRWCSIPHLPSGVSAGIRGISSAVPARSPTKAASSVSRLPQRNASDHSHEGGDQKEARRDTKVFWSNGLVGSITTFAICFGARSKSSVGRWWRPSKAGARSRFVNRFLTIFRNGRRGMLVRHLYRRQSARGALRQFRSEL